ncbi:MAG: V-type ATP synthase subunit I [Candidatus Aminicenantales bacterium]
MIAPMKKVWLVFLEKEKAGALRDLRDLGAVHVECARAAGGEIDRLARTREEISTALNIIPQVKNPAPGGLAEAESIALARRVLADEDRIKELQDESAAFEKEIDRAAAWGDFDPAAIAALRAGGADVRLFEVDAKNLGTAPEEAELVVLARRKRRLFVAAIRRGAPVPVFPQTFFEFVPPLHSAAEMRERIAAMSAEIAERKEGQADAAKETASLRDALGAVEQDIRFEIVHESFTSEGPVCHVKGFIPVSDFTTLSSFAKSRGWAFAADDPSGDDMVPTKVQNNRFVRMIDPVFEFLGTVPGYNEFEISAWFLIFFALFFAMIFGDGGYGLLMLGAGLFAAFKAKRRNRPVPDGVRLLLFLSGALVLWGTATASWFSIPVASLPPFLRAISVWPISGANPNASENVQVFCFLVGVVQLSIARIKNIRRLFPNLRFLSQLGSLAMIFGMLFFVLNLVVDAERFPAPPYAVGLVVGGFAANLIFGSYDGNILKSLLGGLQNIIPIFLGTVGVFADIVSYIRLWAVGLAGTSLGGIINTMGGGMLKPVLMAVFGVLLLTFGHTLNLVLSVLSVIVHGIRLNMLEFSNHLGMEWSGIKYDPFRVTVKSGR